MVRYARRTDTNHSEIVNALRAMGVGVFDASGAGGGISDLICSWRGRVYLVEIKHKSNGLTVAQKALREMLERHGTQLYVVKSVDDAIRLFGGACKLTGPERFAEYAA